MKYAVFIDGSSGVVKYFYVSHVAEQKESQSNTRHETDEVASAHIIRADDSEPVEQRPAWPIDASKQAFQKFSARVRTHNLKGEEQINQQSKDITKPPQQQWQSQQWTTHKSRYV